MKTSLLAFFVMILTQVAPPARAAEPLPLIRKSNSPGYVPPEYARSQVCDVYRDHVVVTQYFGDDEAGVALKETKPVEISAGIEKVIQLSANEKSESQPNGLCDGPSTSVAASLDGKSSLALFSTGGCGTPSLTRNGPHSRKLMDLVDSFCPLTHSPPSR